MIGQPVGNYVIDAQIGEGGMGAVYRAHHAMLGRFAAIKILLPQYSADKAIVQRFFNEAKSASAIRHLGIVEIYDYGLMPDGVAYIAMELLEGISLAGRVREMVGSPVPALHIVRQICGALGAAHERGIVHRDLKPDNVYLIRDDEVVGGQRIKLLDFGIAKLVGNQSQTKTRTGTLMGTPTYMSPEQCRGVQVDHRADLYSLGCMLFEMLVGRPPFQGEGVGDILGAHMYVQPPSVDASVPGLPPGCGALVEQLLAKDPNARPQTTHDVVAAIDHILRPLTASGSAAPAVVFVPSSSQTGPVAVATTTLSSMAGSSIAPAHKPRRVGLIAILAGMVVAAGVAIAIAASQGGARDETARAASPPPAARPAIDAAPAPVATPPPPPPAAAVETPSTIHVSITGTPAGGRVLLDGKDLGPIPFTTTLPRTDKALVFTVRHAGFKDATVEASASADIDRTVALEAAAKPRPAGPAVTTTTTTAKTTPPPVPGPRLQQEARGQRLGQPVRALSGPWTRSVAGSRTAASRSSRRRSRWR